MDRNDSFDEEAHHALAREIASEGIVLLKNDGVLPLKGEERIAVIGHSAIAPRYQGGGSSHINPIQLDIPLDEIKKIVGDTRVTYTQGDTGKDTFDQSLIDEAVKAAETANVALLFIALPASIESEGYDREDLNLTEQQISLIQAVSKAQPKSVVILNTGSAIAMSE